METLSSPIWVAIPLVVIILAVVSLFAILVRGLGKKVEPINDMSTVETPAKTTSLQLTLYLVMAVTIILAILIRIMSPGWFLVFLCIPLMFLAALHFMFQVRAIRRVSKMKPSYISLILLSDLFFFLGFALQTDFGDQGGGYLAIVAFYDYFFSDGTRTNISGVNSYLYMYISLGFLVALIVSWFFLRGKYFLKQENNN